MSPKLVYFVPEFPTQTHSFFWREIQALEQQKINILIASTVRPSTSLCPQLWAEKAHQRTLYAFPPWRYFKDLLNALPKMKLRGIWKAISLILNSKDTSFRSKLKLLIMFGIGLFFGAHLIRRQVNHIHSHFQYSGADIVLFIHMIYGVTYSITRHGDNCQAGNQEAKWGYASFGIVVTERLRLELQREQPQLSTPLTVAPMGVNTQFFQRHKPYEPFQQGQSILRLFCCSRVNPAKGYTELIHCIASLLEKDIDVQLRVAGQDEQGGYGYMQEVMKLSKELGIHKNVAFLGSVDQVAVKNELEKTHIFILPTKSEALGVAFMEAMAMEVPVIGCRVGGVPELITDRITGILVEPGDIEGLVRAVERIIKDPNRSKRMGRAARKEVEDKFSPQRSVRALVAGLRQHTNFFADGA